MRRDATCTIAGCNGAHVSRGYCSAHYNRWNRYGDPTHIPPPRAAHSEPCQVAGCERRRETAAYCFTHYNRWRRYGDPLAPKPIQPTLKPNSALPVAPLNRALARRVDEVPIGEENQKAIKRARERGLIDPALADRIAIQVLGVHPALIWGDDWWIPQEVAA